MPQPRALILRAPGTNCDGETAFAFEQAGAKADRWHVNQLLENPRRLAEFQILCLPGGFSYGDDISAGRILGNQIRHHLCGALQDFKSAGKLILGICNGFQILIKSGILLPIDPRRGAAATLTWNESGRFEDRWVRLAVSGSNSVFFAGIDSLELPVAHAEGKFVVRDEQVLNELEHVGQLVLRYQRRGAEGTALPGREPSTSAVPYPDNPNGSLANVAGICDTTGRVCGLMPHPERHIDPTQHPQWTRRPKASVGEGLRIFQNAVRYFT